MSKAWIPALAAAALLAGCATPQRGAIPVVDSGAPLSELEQGSSSRGGYNQAPAEPRRLPEDSGVVVMVPGASSGAPIAAPASSAPISGSITSGAITPGPITSGPAASEPSVPSYGAPNSSYGVPSYSAPAPSAPTGIPSNTGGLSADEQLDGPVLALLTTAQQQQGAVISMVRLPAWSVPSASLRANPRCSIAWPKCAWPRAMRPRPSNSLVVR